MLEVYMRAMLLKIFMVMLAAALIVPPMTLAQAQGDSPSGFFLYSLTNDAQLFVDGQERGVVPVEGLVPLSPGQHTVKLMRRGFAQRTEIVEVGVGEELELEWDLVPFAGVVRISTNAGKAELWLNGKPFGDIPFDGEIPMGKHKLEALASGFVPAQREMEINGGEEYSFSFDMKPAPVQAVVATAESSVMNKWWFWTATGAVVVGGIVTGIILSTDGGDAPPSPEVTLVF